MNSNLPDPSDSDFLNFITGLDTTDLYTLTLKVQSTFFRDEIAKGLRKSPQWRSSKSILEVGCGPGDSISFFNKEGLLKNKNYLGIDLEKRFIEAARERMENEGTKNIQFLEGNILKNSFGKFDSVLLIAVLQHLGDLNHAVPKIKDHLNNEGALFSWISAKKIL